MTDAREVIAEALEDTGILLQLAAADSILQALERAGYVVRRKPRPRPKMCDECGKFPADPPSSLCPGCDAYREHTGAI